MNKLLKKVILLAIPSLIGFCVFYILPYFQIIKYAITTTKHDEIGLTNFIKVIGNQYFQKASLNTAIFTVISIPLLIIGGYLLACFISTYDIRTISLLLFIPALIPSVSAAELWRIWIDKYEMTALVLLFIWKNVGLSALIFIFGFSKVSKEACEAASIDGANKYQVQWYIFIPTIFPDMIFCALLGIIQSSKIFREIYLLYGNYPPDNLYLLPHYIFNKFNKLDYSDLSAGTILYSFTEIIIPVLIIFITRKNIGKKLL